MSEIEITKWIDVHIKDIDSEENSKVYLEELVVLIIQLTVDELSPDFPQMTMYDRIYNTIKRADELWVYAGAHMDSKYGIPLFRYGILVFLKMPQFTYDDVNDQFQPAYDDYISYLDAKIDHRKENLQPALLKEYFALLRDIKTYYQDPKDYVDDDTRSKGQRILEIYNELLGGS